jgi:hypothetical protein
MCKTDHQEHHSHKMARVYTLLCIPKINDALCLVSMIPLLLRNKCILNPHQRTLWWDDCLVLASHFSQVLKPREVE